MPIYFKLISENLFFAELSFLNIYIYVLITIVILYLVHLITFLFELVLVKLFCNIKIKYLVIYPFTYDGKIYFKPIKLLITQEYFRDSFPINLALQKSFSDNELRSNFKKILHCREVSTFLAFGIVFFIMKYCFQVNLFIELVISFICTLTVTFLSDGHSWNGTRHILKNNGIKKYLYTLPKIDEISESQYANFLADTQKMKEKKTVFDIEYIDILENYLVACFYESKLTLDLDILQEFCSDLLLLNGKINLVNMKYDPYRLSVIKLIGLVGKKIKNEELIILSKNLLNKINIIVSQYYYYGKFEESIKEYIAFINGEILTIQVSRNFVLNQKNIFQHRSLIEQSIINECH